MHRKKDGSKYITPEGNQRLVDEFKHLWRVLRPEVTKALAAAAAEGDRSENAEYIYRKKQLREIDSRIHFLKERLENIQVVDQAPADGSRVFFGAWVRLEDDDGREVLYRIVGSDEFDPDKGWISVDSPLARALLKKTMDDEVTIDLPTGRRTYAVLEVAYQPLRTKTDL